jgi:hypothetical protein
VCVLDESGIRGTRSELIKRVMASGQIVGNSSPIRSPVAQSRYMRMSANSVRITRDSAVGRWSPADGSTGPFYAIDRLPFDYFHSQSLDATLSLASVSCSNTPTMPASFAKFPLAFVK